MGKRVGMQQLFSSPIPREIAISTIISFLVGGGNLRGFVSGVSSLSLSLFPHSPSAKNGGEKDVVLKGDFLGCGRRWRKRRMDERPYRSLFFVKENLVRSSNMAKGRKSARGNFSENQAKLYTVQ